MRTFSLLATVALTLLVASGEAQAQDSSSSSSSSAPAPTEAAPAPAESSAESAADSPAPVEATAPEARPAVVMSPAAAAVLRNAQARHARQQAQEQQQALVQQQATAAKRRAPNTRKQAPARKSQTAYGAPSPAAKRLARERAEHQGSLGQVRPKATGRIPGSKAFSRRPLRTKQSPALKPSRPGADGARRPR